MAGRGGVARKQWQMTGKESVTMGQWQMTGNDGVAKEYWKMTRQHRRKQWKMAGNTSTEDSNGRWLDMTEWQVGRVTVTDLFKIV